MPGDRPIPAFLDACVLYPPLVRALLLGAAEAGLYLPLWSERVLEEWRIAVARNNGLEAEAVVEATRARMTEKFPDAMVAGRPEEPEGVTLPDPADLHVLGAAIAGGAQALVTFNLRDFPRKIITPLGLEVRHPDGFLWELLSTAPDEMMQVIEAAFAAQSVGTNSGRNVLKRARLPRFAKSWSLRQQLYDPD